MEIIGASLKGIYRDILIGANGDPIHDSGWVSNTIVDRCRILLAGFMKNESVGIQYLAVGQGLEAWDTAGVPAPNPDKTTTLEVAYEPHIDVDDLKLNYLGVNDQVISRRSPRLQITATLEPGYPAPLSPLTSYPLREFGLFGRVGNSDYMINCIRHPVIHKDESATLIRVVRLYF